MRVRKYEALSNYLSLNVNAVFTFDCTGNHVKLTWFDGKLPA